jgi:hypothetical protein
MYNYQQKNQNKSSSIRKKSALGLIGIIIAIGLIGGGLYLRSRSDKNSSDPTKVPTINYAPATPSEKQQAIDAKDKIVAQQKNSTPSSPTIDTSSNNKKIVYPTITNTNGSINALVTGVFEEGGTCTATFTKGSGTLSKTSVGFQNVSYTQCAPMNIEAGFLTPGTWSVVVTYSSTSASGSSTSQIMEVK